MTLRPCPEYLNCECDDSPIRNFSSESPDPNTFFRLRFSPAGPPPIGHTPRWYTKESCIGVCESTVSQEDADACALRDSQMCELPPPPGQPGDPVLFGNAAVSCEYPCPEGPPFVYSIPAGTYLALSQELANLTAQSFCTNLAFENHVCSMPGPPPAGPCPVIGSTSTTPVNLQVGDDTILQVFFVYSGNVNDLMFVWFQGNIPVAFTMNSTLTLNDVTEMDQGDYILGIYSPGCAAVFSSAIRVNVNACPAESGTAAPDTLTIAAPVEWEQVTASQSDMAILVSSDFFSNPTGFSYFTPAYGLDHPPGIYGELYTSGFNDESVAGGCGGATPLRGLLAIPFLVNEQYNIDSPSPGGFASLNNGTFSLWSGTPPPGAAQFASYSTPCLAGSVDVQANINIATAGTIVTNSPYPPNEVSQFKHSNIGGMFTYYFSTNDAFTPTLIYSPYIFKVIQIEGQIPQPRKLLINSFAAVAAQFSNPALAANWSGDFNTRDAYTSTDLRWEAGAIGAFGGAIVSYITNHPTSANGKGWKIEIYGAGPTIVWRGYKAIGNTSIGTYYKDNATTPTGPSCLTCADNSDTDWFPPP